VFPCSSAPEANSDDRQYSEGLRTATVSVHYTSDLQRPKLQAYRVARDVPVDAPVDALVDAPVDAGASRSNSVLNLTAAPGDFAISASHHYSLS
jgi:hypothetical protein